MPDRPDAALVAAADAALAATSERIAVVEHDGQRYVAKRLADRPRRLSQALFVRWLVKRVTGQALPMRTLLLSGAVSSVDYEARRLEALARAGVRVPRVVYRCERYLLLEHCGANLSSQLEAWPAETWRSELPRLASELGAFHSAGQWHGAAQIKNLTQKGGHTYRIDFEEGFGERVPLAAAQAVDVVLFLNSISLVGGVDEAEARVLLPDLLARYFEAYPEPQVRAALVNALPLVAALSRLAAPLRGVKQRGRQRKGIARLVILVDALSAYLQG
jgi:tRNA A-37 threonylcarbamoyl transferase component Bud32